MKNKILGKLKKAKKQIMAFALMLYCMVGYSMTVSATIADSKLVTGTKSLLSDSLVAILVLIPTGGALWIGWNKFKEQSEEDDGMIRALKKKNKNILIGIAVAETISGIITILIGYYS